MEGLDALIQRLLVVPLGCIFKVVLDLRRLRARKDGAEAWARSDLRVRERGASSV